MRFAPDVLLGFQVVLAAVMAVYFFRCLKNGSMFGKPLKGEKSSDIADFKDPRESGLTKPLSEKTRPGVLEDIVGQEKGLRALKAALSGPNPCNVIIYGPPGVGKTAAARVVLEYARKSTGSPFKDNAPFIETDGTALQFDERGIADPLIGSVHDPIYQGAGAYGGTGVPQPKPGAVTRAHGGILFIDEIGELHNGHMARLLKVLEDRKVFFNSSYYSPANKSIPRHIHDIFKNGLPADFRLIGATTRRPDEIPPALRSRCTEIFFDSLSRSEITDIAENACLRAGYEYDLQITASVAGYAVNGREAINIIETAVSLAALENRRFITSADIEDAAESGRYTPRQNRRLNSTGKTGVAYGLGICSGGGMVLEIESAAEKSGEKGSGTLKITGIITEEKRRGGSKSAGSRESARDSIYNALTVLKNFGVNPKDYNIHINFPENGSVDGASAGAAILTSLYSALTGLMIPGRVVIIGELTIKGRIASVGGITAKLEASVSAGANTVIMPKSGRQSVKPEKYPALNIIYAENAEHVLTAVFGIKTDMFYPPVAAF